MVQYTSSTYCHLNDVAVALLEHNCFLQVVETCKDALISSKKENIVIDAANDRVGSREPFPKAPSINYSSVSMEQLCSTCYGKKNIIDFVFEAFGSDENNKGPRTSFIVIRCGNRNISIDLAQAIISYNLGVAHQAYAVALLLKKRRQMAFTNQNLTATKMYRSSESTLAALSPVTTSEETNTLAQEIDLFQILVFHLIVLMNLHQQVSVGTSEERQVRNKLIDIHSRVSIMLELHDMEKTAAVSLLKKAKDVLANSISAPSA